MRAVHKGGSLRDGSASIFLSRVVSSECGLHAILSDPLNMVSTLFTARSTQTENTQTCPIHGLTGQKQRQGRGKSMEGGGEVGGEKRKTGHAEKKRRSSPRHTIRGVVIGGEERERRERKPSEQGQR